MIGVYVYSTVRIVTTLIVAEVLFEGVSTAFKDGVIVERVLVKVLKLILKDITVTKTSKRLLESYFTIPFKETLTKLRLIFKYIVSRDIVAYGISNAYEGYTFAIIKINDFGPLILLSSNIENLKLLIKDPYSYIIFVGVRDIR